MQALKCACGQRVFFDNTRCTACGRGLGFAPDRLEMLAGQADGGGLTLDDGERRERCGNHARHRNCNWLLGPGETEGLCQSCRLNRVIPTLTRSGNLQLWTRVEQAKRRLVCGLLRLGLPLVIPGGHALAFRIMEDRRRNPAVFESFVATAHLDGTITINIMEADDAARHAVRQQMCERYRTVLGHLRHESGHYYFYPLSSPVADECRALFGDERIDYQAALSLHYDNGPPGDWQSCWISAYAAAHPLEDFAETFAHYLHIADGLETAQVAGMKVVNAGEAGWLDDWGSISVTLNELLRSLGGDDPYPFVLTAPVRGKLEFMHRSVQRLAGRG